MNILTGNIKRVAMIGGKKISYDLCGDSKHDYKDWPRAKTKCIGKGYIHSVRDVAQNPIGTKKNMWFFNIS